MHLYWKKLSYLLLCCLFSASLMAQDPSYYVYIQSEHNQPFYVKYNGKVLSSSVKGYLIISQLPQGDMPITIGFPKNELPEESFTIRVNGRRDRGYLLKSNNGKSFALYDLQTFAMLKAKGMDGEDDNTGLAQNENEQTNDLSSESGEVNNVEEVSAVTVAGKEEKLTPPLTAEKLSSQTASSSKNAFAAALDKVISDDRPDDIYEEAAASVDTIVNKKISKPRTPKKARAPLTEEEKAILAGVMADEKLAADKEAAQAAEEAAKIAAEDAWKEVNGKGELPENNSKAKIEEGGMFLAEEAASPKATYSTGDKEKPGKKSKKKKNTSEPDFIDFGDVNAGAGSTTPLSSGSESESKPSKKEKRQKKNTEEAAAVTEPVFQDETGEDSKKTRKEEREARKADAKKAAGEKDDSGVKMINSDCGELLSVEDFRKLIRKMSGAKDEEGMIDVFRKSTRKVCLSSEQVRTLVQLFETDQYRYRLMDTAYARTFDSDNFGRLVNLLQDEYYIGRFKALTRKH